MAIQRGCLHNGGYDLDRQELLVCWRLQRAGANLSAPMPQQAPAEIMPTRHLDKARTKLIRLGDNPKLLLNPPPPPPLNPADDLQCTRPLRHT